MARTHNRAIPLLGVLVVAMIGVGLITAGAVGADITTADRTIEETELLPGETTEVTVEIDLTEEAGPFLAEEFDPAFADVSINNADPFFEIGGSTDANDALTAGWGDDSTEYSVTYEVTVPEDADPGEEFEINGTVTTTDGDGNIADSVAVAGDTTITVVEQDTEFGERSIDTNEVIPGGDVEVSVEIVPPTTGTPFLIEAFDPAFADASIKGADPAPVTSGVNNATDELIAGWDDSVENYTLTYVITVHDDSEPGETYHIDGEVTVSTEGGNEMRGDIVGDTNLSVVAPPEGPEDYADEESGQVDGNGVSNAFEDWQNGVADSQTLQDVFGAWQRGDIVL